MTFANQAKYKFINKFYKIFRFVSNITIDSSNLMRIQCWWTDLCFPEEPTSLFFATNTWRCFPCYSKLMRQMEKQKHIYMFRDLKTNYVIAFYCLDIHFKFCINMFHNEVQFCNLVTELVKFHRRQHQSIRVYWYYTASWFHTIRTTDHNIKT